MPITRKKTLILFATSAILFISAGIYAYYYVTRTFKDSSEVRSDFEVDAFPFIAEFENDPKTANARYSEKMITVRGRISTLEQADTGVNIKIINPASGSYVIFAMQSRDLPTTRVLKENDSITVKGSCGNGTFSNILSSYYITFSRCTLVQKTVNNK